MRVQAGNTLESQRLKCAVLIYDSFATVHPIQIKGASKAPLILPGVLATTDALSGALRGLLPATDMGTGFISETLLATGVDHMVWWVKPTVRQVFFACGELGGARSAFVPNPGLVMAVVRGDWYVWAVKGLKRPTPTTQLYQAPYFNVWSDGRICVGSTVLPSGEQIKETTAWEEAFFGSSFTHTNVHAPEKLVKAASEYQFWADMLDGRYAKFPEGKLVDRSITVQALLYRLINKE